MVRIENWSVVSKDDIYTAPELARFALAGDVFDHPRLGDAEGVTTSSIKSSNGRTVTTSSGTKYSLGQPSSDYVEWCRKNGRTLDEANPVKVRTI
jgi:hypothetical protein